MALFMSLVIGTLFLSLPTTFAGGASLSGLLFQSICFLMLLSVPTVEITFGKKPVLFRQRDALFFPPWVGEGGGSCCFLLPRMPLSRPQNTLTDPPPKKQNKRRSSGCRRC